MVPGVEDADFSSLQIIVYGASPISDDVLARSIEVFKCKFWQAYGMTESTGTVVNLPPEDHDLNGPNTHRLRSCGVAGPGVELRIVDVDATTDTAIDVPTGEVGEIWVRSPQVMKGYWKLPEETAEGDHARWLAANGRRRIPGRRRLPVHPRSREGHDRVGWRERVPGRGRERVDGPSGGRRLRRHRGAPRHVGRDGEGDRRARRRERPDRTGVDRLLPRAAGAVQVPHQRRVDRRSPAQPERQDPEEGPPRALLGGPTTAGCPKTPRPVCFRSRHGFI